MLSVKRNAAAHCAQSQSGCRLLGGGLLVLLAMMVAACSGGPADGTRLKGHFDHLQQAQLFVYSDDAAFGRIDTINVSGGDFEYTCTVHEPMVLTIVYPNFSETMFVAEVGDDLEYDADVSNLRMVSIKGTAANDSLTAFRQRHAEASIPLQRKAAEAYIRQHPGDMAAVALFMKYFEQAERIEAEPTATLLALLQKAQPKHQGVSAMARRMKPLLQSAIGAKAPETLTRGGLPALVIFTLSSQYASTTLANAARECTDGTNVRLEQLSGDCCDLDSLRRTCGMRYIPGNILIDEDGTIVARDIPFNELATHVKKLQKQP